MDSPQFQSVYQVISLEHSDGLELGLTVDTNTRLETKACWPSSLSLTFLKKGDACLPYCCSWPLILVWNWSSWIWSLSLQPGGFISSLVSCPSDEMFQNSPVVTGLGVLWLSVSVVPEDPCSLEAQVPIRL